MKRYYFSPSIKFHRLESVMLGVSDTEGGDQLGKDSDFNDTHNGYSNGSSLPSSKRMWDEDDHEGDMR